MKKFLTHIEEKRGLWDNIHAKRRRIKAGSGEHMRKPGSEGAPTAAAIKASQNEAKDSGEYDYEGDMAMSQLKSVITNAKKLHDMLKPNTNLPEWVQSKITLAEDYIVTAANYMEGELSEETEHTNCDTPECCGNCDTAKVEELQERGANKYKRSTESGAGLTRAGVMKHRRENPGSKLSTAVTTPPSKLKKGSKAANRRKSFCARMSGMKGPMKDKKGRPTRKAMSLRRWNCN
jgi:hypothetical protein